MIAIIDYGAGNLRSMVNAIGRLGYQAGTHMKEYQGKGLALVIGSTAQHFLSEYMAGFMPIDGGGLCCVC